MNIWMYVPRGTHQPEEAVLGHVLRPVLAHELLDLGFEVGVEQGCEQLCAVCVCVQRPTTQPNKFNQSRYSINPCVISTIAALTYLHVRSDLVKRGVQAAPIAGVAGCVAVRVLAGAQTEPSDALGPDSGAATSGGAATPGSGGGGLLPLRLGLGLGLGGGGLLLARCCALLQELRYQLVLLPRLRQARLLTSERISQSIVISYDFTGHYTAHPQDVAGEVLQRHKGLLLRQAFLQPREQLRFRPRLPQEHLPAHVLGGERRVGGRRNGVRLTWASADAIRRREW